MSKDRSKNIEVIRSVNIEPPKKKILTEIYSRVSGYFRPVNQWNKAKQEEFKDRKFVPKEKIR